MNRANTPPSPIASPTLRTVAALELVLDTAPDVDVDVEEEVSVGEPGMELAVPLETEEPGRLADADLASSW